MHGIIVRYDPLTQCGLLRTNAGQVHYFRRDEVVSSGAVVTGQPVALRNGVLVDTGGSRMDTHVPNPPPHPIPPPPAPAAPTNSGPYFGWIVNHIIFPKSVFILPDCRPCVNLNRLTLPLL